MKYACVSLLVVIQLAAMEQPCAKLRELANFVSSHAALLDSDASDELKVIGSKEISADKKQSAIPTRKRKSHEPNVVKLYGFAFELLKHPKTNRTQYLCITCDRIFGNSRPHALWHAGLKPYECKCGKSFRQPAHLKGHKRSTVCPFSLQNLEKFIDNKQDDTSEVVLT